MVTTNTILAVYLIANAACLALLAIACAVLDRKD
jgi:hypothetical protein